MAHSVGQRTARRVHVETYNLVETQAGIDPGGPPRSSCEALFVVIDRKESQ
jgi:hypothetical protein